MAEKTGHVVLLILGAVEPGAVRVATRSSHAVTPHAELLTSTAVTAGTRHRIDASLLAMLSARRRHPVGGVRIARDGARGDVRCRVAGNARVFAVARRTEAWIRASLESMSRLESGSMKA